MPANFATLPHFSVSASAAGQNGAAAGTRWQNGRKAHLKSLNDVGLDPTKKSGGAPMCFVRNRNDLVVGRR
jgi:hypothetical protein